MVKQQYLETNVITVRKAIPGYLTWLFIFIGEDAETIHIDVLEDRTMKESILEGTEKVVLEENGVMAEDYPKTLRAFLN